MKKVKYKDLIFATSHPLAQYFALPPSRKSGKSIFNCHFDCEALRQAQDKLIEKCVPYSVLDTFFPFHYKITRTDRFI